MRSNDCIKTLKIKHKKYYKFLNIALIMLNNTLTL